MSLKLNTQKIQSELTRLGENQSWLALKLKCTRQNISDIMRRRPIKQASRIGEILGIDAKDLICEE